VKENLAGSVALLEISALLLSRKQFEHSLYRVNKLFRIRRVPPLMLFHTQFDIITTIGVTGLSTMDYLADPVSIPEEDRHFFSERFWLNYCTAFSQSFDTTPD
jgi:hypothetical protein